MAQIPFDVSVFLQVILLQRLDWVFFGFFFVLLFLLLSPDTI